MQKKVKPSKPKSEREAKIRHRLRKMSPRKMRKMRKTSTLGRNQSPKPSQLGQEGLPGLPYGKQEIANDFISSKTISERLESVSKAGNVPKTHNSRLLRDLVSCGDL